MMTDIWLAYVIHNNVYNNQDNCNDGVRMIVTIHTIIKIDYSFGYQHGNAYKRIIKKRYVCLLPL